MATASAAGQLSLVVLRQVEACATDELYDDVVAVVERFLDETPATLTTAHGEVTKALVGFVLLAPCLTTERCHTIEASGGHAAPNAGGRDKASALAMSESVSSCSV